MTYQKHYLSKNFSHLRRSPSLVLTERRAVVCNRPVLYALLAKRTDLYGTLFWIRIKQARRSHTLPIGSDCHHAMSCFEKIVRGRVTVYTLADVLYDLQHEDR